MLRINLFKLLLFILILGISVNVVYGVYPAVNGQCDANKDGVKIGDWCYDCGDSDGICPDDFSQSQLSQSVCKTTSDPDCFPENCHERTQEQCTLFKDAQGNNCAWYPECNINKGHSSKDNSGCYVVGSVRYDPIIGECGAECTSPNQCQTMLCGPNSVGSCQEQCANYVCQACTPQCTCNSGWKDLDGYSYNGCEAPACVPTGNEICDGKDNDCDGQIDESLVRSCYTGPAGTQDVGICRAGTEICTSGNWGACQNQVLPASEVCSDSTNKDEDCDGGVNCQDVQCAGNPGPNGFTCCQTKSNCPADGTASYLTCANDNTISGTQQTYACTSNECIASNQNLQSSCNTGCCYPGTGGSVCKNPDKSSMMDIDVDSKYEICSSATGSGDWIGGNCQGSSCVTDPAQPGSYNCVIDSDCSSLNAGQCGEVKCVNNQCTTQAKSTAQSICEGISNTNGYKCAVYSGCAGSAGNQWQCQFTGISSLCGDPNNPASYDLGCSQNYKCDVNLCSPSESPCGLCYSQCIIAANDPNRAPYSEQECKKNGLWAQCGGF